MRHHVVLRLLRHFEVPDGDTAIAVTANELLALVVPAYRSPTATTAPPAARGTKRVLGASKPAYKPRLSVRDRDSRAWVVQTVRTLAVSTCREGTSLSGGSSLPLRERRHHAAYMGPTVSACLLVRLCLLHEAHRKLRSHHID